MIRPTSAIVVGLSLQLIVVCGCASSAPTTTAPRIDTSKLVDLSYPYGPDTIYWPTAQQFKMQRVAFGRTLAGYFYYANNIATAEHGGTHMDAPLHFAESKRTADKVPLSNCVGPLVVIDVTEQAARDADYRVTVDDVRKAERLDGKIERGSIVLMRSGWGLRWPDKKRYLGTDAPGDVDHLHFPGFSKEAAEFLVRDRNVAAIAVDTASIDYGQSKDFIVHQTVGGADKPAFENVANVQLLPARGATFIALPMKIQDGSGGPTRIITVLP